MGTESVELEIKVRDWRIWHRSSFEIVVWVSRANMLLLMPSCRCLYFLLSMYLYMHAFYENALYHIHKSIIFDISITCIHAYCIYYICIVLHNAPKETKQKATLIFKQHNTTNDLLAFKMRQTIRENYFAPLTVYV